MSSLLILGGTYFQIPVIKYAKSQNHRVITCDYFPNNPGHSLADSYVDVSTTDKKAILSVANEYKVDGILAYASDPAAPTAAYVAEQLHLPGNSYKSVKTLSEKHLFRKFLQDNSFNCPEFTTVKDFCEFENTIKMFSYPYVVKPVDSSGSKGVTIINTDGNTKKTFDNAIKYSRSGIVIVEEFINGPQIHGDGFVIDGKLLFAHLGDHLFNGKTNNSTMYPSKLSDEIIDLAKNEVNKVIQKSGFKNGGINIEIRINESTQEPHIIEIGARNGGHLTPDAITLATNFDFAQAAVDASLGITYKDQKITKNVHTLNLILYTKKNGVFKSVDLDPLLLPFVKNECIYKKRGDKVIAGTTSDTSIGVLQLQFNSREDMESIYNSVEDLYKIQLE